MSIFDVSEDAILMSIFDISEDANGEEKKTTGETATEPAGDSSIKAPDIDLPPQTRQVLYAKKCINMQQKLSRDQQGETILSVLGIGAGVFNIFHQQKKLQSQEML